MEILALAVSFLAIAISIFSLVVTMQLKNTINKFFGDSSVKEKLTSDLDKYYEETKTVLSKYQNVFDDVEKIKKDNLLNFSSYAIRRFNPYEEAGGDLSFCLTMLNKNKDGAMITSLHGRERTRIYTRNIAQGEVNSEILYDEKETLKEALEKLDVK